MEEKKTKHTQIDEEKLTKKNNKGGQPGVFIEVFMLMLLAICFEAL